MPKFLKFCDSDNTDYCINLNHIDYYSMQNIPNSDLQRFQVNFKGNDTTFYVKDVQAERISDLMSDMWI